MNGRTIDLPADAPGPITLAAQGLMGHPTGALDLVERLVAIQSQVSSTPGLSLVARGVRLSIGEIDRLQFTERALLRFWNLRATVHTVPASLAGTIVSATSATWADGYYRWVWRRARIARGEVERLEEAILAALSGEPMTREDLWARVPRLADLPMTNWGVDLRGLAYRGQVAHGPPRGGRATFVRTDRWVDPALLTGPPHELALADLARRYLCAYGPASAADFAHWTGLRAGIARRAFDGLAPELVAVRLDGRPTALHLLARDVARARRAGPPARVRLLPRFDPLVLGHRDKGRFLDPAHQAAVFRQAAEVRAVVLVDGRVAATWRHEKRAHALRIEVEPLTRLPAPVRRQISDEAARVRDYLAPASGLEVSYR